MVINGNEIQIVEGLTRLTGPDGYLQELRVVIVFLGITIVNSNVLTQTTGLTLNDERWKDVSK